MIEVAKPTAHNDGGAKKRKRVEHEEPEVGSTLSAARKQKKNSDQKYIPKLMFVKFQSFPESKPIPAPQFRLRGRSRVPRSAKKSRSLGKPPRPA